MATGPEHYAEAERLLFLADYHEDSGPQDHRLRKAQVHATLALAAATAPITHRNVVDETAAWAAVTGTAPPHIRLTWWLDDGQENADAPRLYTTEAAARDAGVKQYRDDNFGGSREFDWLAPDSPDGDEIELVVNGRRTGIFVRPVRPKDGA